MTSWYSTLSPIYMYKNRLLVYTRDSLSPWTVSPTAEHPQGTLYPREDQCRMSPYSFEHSRTGKQLESEVQSLPSFHTQLPTKYIKSVFFNGSNKPMAKPVKQFYHSLLEPTEGNSTMLQCPIQQQYFGSTQMYRSISAIASFHWPGRSPASHGTGSKTKFVSANLIQVQFTFYNCTQYALLSACSCCWRFW